MLGSTRGTWWWDRASDGGWAGGLNSRFLTSACPSTPYLGLKSTVCCRNFPLLSAHLQASSGKPLGVSLLPTHTPFLWGQPRSLFPRRPLQVPQAQLSLSILGDRSRPPPWGAARAKLINGRAIDEGARPQAIHHCRLPGPVRLQMEKEMM